MTTESIVKRCGGGETLGGVGVVLHPGEIHGLPGENGAGKTTLLNTSTVSSPPMRGQAASMAQPVPSS
ncbi:MAG: ATP-binding cassette domain-containing protein [Thermoleophilaceae bacterium]